MSLQVGQALNNRYRIVRLLGQGGFGAVYRAWDINLNRPCAVKENLDTSSEAQRQFTREATVLANLSHPNLPRVTDHFILPEQGQYLVMDFVDGEDLASLLKHQSPLPVAQVLPWITQVADALIYLHSRHPPVVHRDVKPANIRLTPDGRAMLVDFGLVKLFNPSLRTTLGARAVTPGYAPPEQYGQGNTDARTDLYALGATLYNLITGQEPMESVQRMVGGKMPAASALNSQVPAAVSTAIEKAMHLEPSQRFSNLVEFKAALLAPVEAPFLVRPAADAYVRPAAGPAAEPLAAGPPPARIPATQVMPPPRPAVPMPAIPHAPAYQPAPEKKSRSSFWVGLIVFLIICLAGALLAGILASQGQQTSGQQTNDANARLAAARGQQTATAQLGATLTAMYDAAQVQSTRQAREALIAAAENTKIVVFQPTSGELTHNADDTAMAGRGTGVNLRNFIAEARLYNPYAASDGGWDYGFAFRTTGGNNEFRLVVGFDRTWVLMNNTGGPQGIVIARGELPDLDVSADGSHLIRLIAKDERGVFLLDGNVVADLDLSAHINSGDIFLFTGMYKGHERNRFATLYTDLTVWSIP